MLTDSMLQYCSNRSHVVRVILSAVSALALSVPLAAMAQEPLSAIPLPKLQCGADVKEQVAEALGAVKDAAEADKLATEADLYAKYAGCAQDAKLIPNTSFYVAARECSARVSYIGSLYFEEMSCCGYDPQRRTFACPVKIKQPWGFGGAPLPGSREHVLHCVADGNGTLQPVGHDSVHLANALGGQPTWQFAVVANAIWNLHTVYPMSGATRRARSILSWAFTPTSCDYKPIWGNVLDYPIRLDQ